MRETNGYYNIPEGWVWVHVEDIAANEKNAIVDGPFGSNLKVSDYVDDVSAVPVLTTKNLEGNYNRESLRFISQTKFQELKRSEVKGGDILVAKIGSCGKTGVYPTHMPSAIIPANLLKITVHPQIVRLFVLYYLNCPSFKKELAEITTATAQPAFNVSKFRKLPLPLPPIDEQHRIVTKIEELFTELEAGVASLKKTRVQLKRYRQAVLKAAVTGELTREWREAHKGELEPAGDLLARILRERRGKWEADQLAKMGAVGKLPKNDEWKNKYQGPTAPDVGELPELPGGWIWTNIQQVGEVSGGITKNQKREKLPLKLPYLRVANVYAEELNLAEVKNIGIEEGELERALLAVGDLLIVEGNGSIDQIGRVALWDGRIEPCLHQNHLIKVRLNPIQIGDYILWWLLSREGRDFITKAASSTSGLHTLSISKVAGLPIPLPPLAEQLQIVSEVERLLSITDATEQAIEQGLKQAERLRQSILHQAFAGKLVSQDPADEPAETLLARIRAERTQNGSVPRKIRRPMRNQKQSTQPDLLP